MSDAYASVLQYFNVALTCVFAVEAVVKLIGFGLYVSVPSIKDRGQTDRVVILAKLLIL